jgi:hypothetical protein
MLVADVRNMSFLQKLRKSSEKDGTYSAHVSSLISGHSLPTSKFYFFSFQMLLASSSPHARNSCHFQFFPFASVISTCTCFAYPSPITRWDPWFQTAAHCFSSRINTSWKGIRVTSLGGLVLVSLVHTSFSLHPISYSNEKMRPENSFMVFFLLGGASGFPGFFTETRRSRSQIARLKLVNQVYPHACRGQCAKRNLLKGLDSKLS